MAPLAALRRYMAADDPRIAAANLIAMVLAWNTPFYPLYLIGSAGAAMQPGAWFTLAIFPVFLAVPLLTRRRPLTGRVLLAAGGLCNTIWCTWLLGEASGTSLFLLPCIFLAGILFRPEERLPLLGFLALPIALGLGLYGHYPTSPFACATAACDSLAWLNAFSVALLCGFVGLVATRLIGATDVTAVAPAPNSESRAPASTRRRLPPGR